MYISILFVCICSLWFAWTWILFPGQMWLPGIDIVSKSVIEPVRWKHLKPYPVSIYPSSCWGPEVNKNHHLELFDWFQSEIFWGQSPPFMAHDQTCKVRAFWRYIINIIHTCFEFSTWTMISQFFGKDSLGWNHQSQLKVATKGLWMLPNINITRSPSHGLISKKKRQNPYAPYVSPWLPLSYWFRHILRLIQGSISP